MKNNRPFSLLLLAALLTGCGEPVDPNHVTIDGIEFEKKEVTTYLRSLASPSTTVAYYRNDGMKNVPYIKLSDYYKNLLGKELTAQETEAGVFSLTSAAGGKAVIDTKKDTLTSADLEQFINTSIYHQDGVENVYYDGAPFLRVKGTTVDKAPAARKIAFKDDYKIDLFALQGDVLLPLDTCSNLFQGPSMLTCFYSPKAFYFLDPNDPDFSTDNVAGDEQYLLDIEGFFEGGKRSKEQAEFSYNELCFFVDTFYGCPGREVLHQDLLRLGKLDPILSTHDDFTKKARDFLQSTDQIEYHAGLTMLADYLADTGHTVLNYGSRLFMKTDEEFKAQVDAKLASIGYVSANVAPTRDGYSYPYRLGVGAARKNAGIETLKTIQKGDTLIYTFDSFYFDQAGWKAYYDGSSTELPVDPVGAFKRVLETYKDGKTIKNIVVDLTGNGGGSADVVFTFMAMMGKDAYLHNYDFVNKNYPTTTYEVDLNFDRKFDEEDKKVSYPYHFALLDSAISFSCGNLLPCQAKESGIMLLGDQTGGGACAVLDGCNAEGLYTRMASQMRLEAKDGSSIDFGVAPHVSIKKTNEEGEYDFSAFYDPEALGQYMDAFYK